MSDGNYVFLSYSHKDNISYYIDVLNIGGYNTVFDETISFGEEWDLKVRRQLSNSRCKGMFVFLSEKSAASNAVLTEIEYAEKYNKPYAAITLNNESPQKIFAEALRSGNEMARFVIENLSVYFPQNKLYLLKNDFNLDLKGKLSQTFKEWGLLPNSNADDVFTASTYTSMILGEKERLHWQENGYVKFDNEAIDKALASLPDNNLTVLDLGCSDALVTYSRFANRPQFKKIIGVDYNQSDLDAAKERCKNDPRFCFYKVDLNSSDFCCAIKNIMQENDIKGFDLVFAAFILQHVQKPKLLLLRLFDLFNPGGKIIIRESDDGSKLCFPNDSLAEEIIKRTNAVIKSSDRIIGRKLYPYLSELGYENIELLYSIDDTINKTRREKEWLFTMGFSFRLNRIKSIYAENPGNEFLKKEIQWLENALDKLKTVFFSRDFYYTVRSYIAIGSA